MHQYVFAASTDDSITTINGTAGDDTLSGTTGTDLINGKAGNDFITGLPYDDYNDRAGGHDTVLGGNGDDYISDGSSVGVQLNGGDGNDTLVGGSSNDTLLGGAGDDLLAGGSGTDLINGGAGNDQVYLDVGASAGQEIDASAVGSATAVTVHTPEGDKTLIWVERVELVGSPDAETLIGGHGDDVIVGIDGADRMFGGDGNDQISAGAGDATLAGGDGDDLLSVDGASGHYHILGGAGVDVVSISAANNETLTGGLANGRLSLVSSSGDLSVDGSAVESLHLNFDGGGTITGGDFDDQIWAAVGTKVRLSGLGGDDMLTGSGTLLGGDGDDTLAGAAHNGDSVNGGAGHDIYVIYDHYGADAGERLDVSHVDLSLGHTSVATSDGHYTLTGIEGLGVHGGYGADTIIGGAGDDRLDGGFGADSVSGGAGDDVVTNQDTFGDEPWLVDRNDTFDGGSGIDTLSYERIGSGMTIDMARGVATSVETGTDSFTNFEIVIGGTGADVVTGSSLADTIEGGAGADRINAGNGNDLIVGGAGADVLTGGAGSDTFRYEAVGDSSAGASDKIIDLTAGDHIDLSEVDADTTTAGDQAFHEVDAFSHAAGELTVTYSAAKQLTYVLGDVDGDGVADLVIRIAGDHSDFSGFVF